MIQAQLKQLQLLQLADTALPVGSAAHSFGLETLVAEGLLTVPQLSTFFQAYLIEVSAPEAIFCRAAYHIWTVTDSNAFETGWLNLNMRLSALKLARESRTASGMIGKRFLQLVDSLTPHPVLALALQVGLQARVELHHATAFGLVGRVLEFDEEATILVYLQQTLACLISACQRLLPLGQRQAAQLLWDLKPALVEVTERTREANIESLGYYTFAMLGDLAAMRHPILPTRLFIS